MSKINTIKDDTTADITVEVEPVSESCKFESSPTIDDLHSVCSV